MPSLTLYGNDRFDNDCRILSQHARRPSFSLYGSRKIRCKPAVDPAPLAPSPAFHWRWSPVLHGSQHRRAYTPTRTTAYAFLHLPACWAESFQHLATFVRMFALGPPLCKAGKDLSPFDQPSQLHQPRKRPSFASSSDINISMASTSLTLDKMTADQLVNFASNKIARLVLVAERLDNVLLHTQKKLAEADGHLAEILAGYTEELGGGTSSVVRRMTYHRTALQQQLHLVDTERNRIFGPLAQAYPVSAARIIHHQAATGGTFDAGFALKQWSTCAEPPHARTFDVEDEGLLDSLVSVFSLDVSEILSDSAQYTSSLVQTGCPYLYQPRYPQPQPTSQPSPSMPQPPNTPQGTSRLSYSPTTPTDSKSLANRQRYSPAGYLSPPDSSFKHPAPAGPLYAPNEEISLNPHHPRPFPQAQTTQPATAVEAGKGKPQARLIRGEEGQLFRESTTTHELQNEVAGAKVAGQHTGPGQAVGKEDTGAWGVEAEESEADDIVEIS